MFELSSFAQSLELFLNLLEFIAILTSVATFFFLMINQYGKALKEILSPCGIGVFPRIRALFICRKSMIKKQAFIEFAILKTQGCPTVAKQWHAILNEFKAYYSENVSAPIYTIPNCTAIIGEEFSEAVERYFEFFSREKVMKTFGLRDDTLAWVTTIRIEEAYATPTCLLTGLLAQYEDNWTEFIKRYVSTAYISDADETYQNDVLADELYYTFAWLLWGPSYELDYQNYWAGLCQLSYGDESNSIPAVANHNTNVAARMVERFKENEGRRYGALVSADVSIHPVKTYFSRIRGQINPENSYFYEKVEKETLSFAVQIDSFSPCENYKAKKYYCTAYVWLLFELDDEEVFAFKPEKSLAFFEHANLTDMNTYQFLVGTLIDKAFKHFESIFSNERLGSRNYRFICAMNDEIAERFLERYNELSSMDNEFAQKLRERLYVEPKRVPSDAFAGYDEYFMQRKQLHFKEITIREKESLSALGQFYTEVYMDCFPDSNERETFDNLLLYLRQAEGSTAYEYHILLAVDDNDDVVGGAIFDYFKRTNAGVVEFLAVRGDLQTSGIGTQIYKKVREVLSADAYQNGKQKLANIFCEIDSPEYSKASIKKYLYFWNKHGYRHLQFSYTQPSLSLMQEPVSGLWLTVANTNGQDVSGDYVLKVIYDYMKYAMQIEDPESNREYKAMEKELKGIRAVERTPIID